MIFNSEEQIFNYIRDNKVTPPWVADAREYSKMLLALIQGENFQDLLIEQIEFLENKDKAASRKKYSRNIVDLFERVLRPIDNIYSSTGGAKHFHNLSDNEIEELTNHLSNVRGGKTLQDWLENTWMNTYHTDPNGIVFLEYDSLLNIKPQPCYKSINTIRNYYKNGQKLEVLLFEPKQLKQGTHEWTIVDDKSVYTVNQVGDETFSIVGQFDHEFGCVPALVNSNIEHIGYEKRLSPVDKIIDICKKYGRDLSVKNVYQQLAGFPRRWSYASDSSEPCIDCGGTGMIGDSVCNTCGGQGTVQASKDVTTEDILEIPEEGQPSIVPASGFVSPDLAFLADTRIEQKELEELIMVTMWGANLDTQAAATATEVIINTQPVTMRLNKYADVAQNMEAMLTDMIANHMFLNKDKDVKVASINYGRNYIIESTDAILNRYESAKENGDNSTVLDRLYHEYLLAKFKSDEVGLDLAIKKSHVEPYLHYSAAALLETVGEKESSRKIMFGDWWKNTDTFTKSKEQLISEYNTYFEEKYQPIAVEKVTDDNE